MKDATAAVPSLAVLETSFDCNRSCVFCSCPWYAPATRYAKGVPVGLEEHMKMIDHYIDGCGVGTIAFSGGEPLLNKNLRGLIEHVSSKTVVKGGERASVEIGLNTNGDLLDDGWLDFLRDRGVKLSVAFPGIRTFALLTGVRGADFRRTLAVIAAAAKKGIAVAANITASRANFGEIYEVMAEALLAGAASLYLNRFLPGGRGLGYVKELTLDQAMLADFIEMASDVLSAANRQGSVGAAIPTCVSGGKGPLLRISRGCSAGCGIFVTDPAGMIRPCSHTPEHSGSWRDHESIMAGPGWSAFRRREYYSENCLGCPSRTECSGGCPEASRITGGSIASDDPVFSLFGKKPGRKAER